MLPNVSDTDAAVYLVLVSNPSGGIYCYPVALTVVDPPVITSQPVGSTNNAGATVTFTAAVTGTSPLTYQWVQNGTGNTLETAGISPAPARRT